MSPAGSARIELVDLQAVDRHMGDALRAAVDRVASSGKFILGDTVATFETALAAYCGVRHAVGVASGSDALYLGLRALEIDRGDEVITSPLTYIATPEAVTRVGARVVFCDVDPITWTLDPEKVAEKITDRTRAILPVHLFGQCADVEALGEVAGSIPIIEDAAQAWGAELRGRNARVDSIG